MASLSSSSHLRVPAAHCACVYSPVGEPTVYILFFVPASILFIIIVIVIITHMQRRTSVTKKQKTCVLRVVYWPQRDHIIFGVQPTVQNFLLTHF